MSVADNTLITNKLAATVVPSEISPVLKTFFWSWFATHQDATVLKKKVLFFSLNITVGQLEPLFVMLFGPRPVVTDSSTL
jgi:hypothetical protein